MTDVLTDDQPASNGTAGPSASTALADLLERKRPATVSEWIVLDSEAADAYIDAKNEFDLAEIRVSAAPNDADRAADLETARAKLDAARERAKAATVEFKFQAIGRIAWEELVTDHRATSSEQAQFRKLNPGGGSLTWSPKTFPPAIVHASLVEPALSVEQVRALWDDPAWSDGETRALLEAAVAVNQRRRVASLD